MYVFQHMTEASMVIAHDTPLRAAMLLLLLNELDHVPVVRSGKFVGILNRNALYEISGSVADNDDPPSEAIAMLEELRAGEIAKPLPARLSVHDSTGRVDELFKLYPDIEWLPVVDNQGKFLGTVTRTRNNSILPTEVRIKKAS